MTPSIGKLTSVRCQAETLLELRASDYALALAPERGGSILRLDWCGLPVMRPTTGPSILDVACFPLVPFCNRIADGRFSWHGREYRLSPNFPGIDHPHPLHGFGWLSPWTVIEAHSGRAVIEHRNSGGEWPWPYCARQVATLTPDGLTLELSLTNLGEAPMPAGIGFHPYFPREKCTRYIGFHNGEWQTGTDGIPVSLDQRGVARDWWQGAAVGSRLVDTVYSDRDGPLRIIWPDRRIEAGITCSSNLSFTAVLTPEGADWFCVEPMSHMTDAINRSPGEAGLESLAECETLVGTMSIEVRHFGATFGY